MAKNLPELHAELTAFVAMAEGAENKYFHIETWQLKSVLTGVFQRPDEADTTERDIPAIDDTGDLSSKQIHARLMLSGELPTQKCKSVRE